MRRNTSIVALTVAAVLLAGCASGSNPTGSESASSNETLKWAAVSGEPPISFTDSAGEPIGMDPDLARAIAEKIGVGVDVTPEAFQNSLLGLDANRLDVVGGAGITAERIKKYDMASYSTGAYGMIIANGGEAIPDSMEELCGLTLAINAGDVFIPMLQEESATCTSAGKEAITVSEFPDATANGLAVQSGRADAWIGPTIALNYAVKADGGKWERSGPEWGQQTIGFVTTKGSGLAEKIASAINELIADGTYQEIMAEYGLEENGITESVVNPSVGDPGK